MTNFKLPVCFATITKLQIENAYLINKQIWPCQMYKTFTCQKYMFTECAKLRLPKCTDLGRVFAK